MKKISRNKDSNRKKETSGKNGKKIKLSGKQKILINRNLVVFAAFAVIGFTIYSNTFKTPFIFDDQAHIPDNPHIQIKELNFKSIIDAGFESPLPQRPVANISFALNYYFNRLDVTGFHLINISIHILTAFFLYLLFKHTLSLPVLQKKYHNTEYLPFCAALVWLAHPLQTQSVTYIVQRMNSLAAMFYILSLLLYVKGRLSQISSSRGWLWFAGCITAGLLSFGCKEIAAMLPFFILLYEWYFFQDMNIAWLKKQIPFIVIATVVFAFLVLLYLGLNPIEKLTSESQRWGFSIPERLLTQSRVIIFYISLLFFPHPGRLNLDHDFGISYSLINPITTIPAIIAILFLLALSVYPAKKERLLSFCILWFFGNLLIESSFVAIEIIYEHRLYLPSMFFILAISAAAWRLIKEYRIKLVLFSVLTVLLGLATYQRNTVWADSVSLWSDCAAKSPNKARPQYNLACELYEQGNYTEAAKYYTRTIELDPSRYDAYEGLAYLYLSEEQISRSIELCDKAIELNPKAERAYYIKGQALYRQNKLDEAILNLQKGIEIDPKLAKIYNDLAVIYNRKGQFENAVNFWKKAIRINPEIVEALNNLAWLLAACQEEKYRDSAESIRLSEKACEITKYNQPDLLDTLAAAYASAGQFEKAVETAQKAVELLNSQGNRKLAEEIEKRIDLYKNSKPYRDVSQINTNINTNKHN